MKIGNLAEDAILRVGEVDAVEGRKTIIRVDKNKNSSDMFIDGDILKNIAVNSLIEIRKGYLSIIGIVEGERIYEDDSVDKNFRVNRSKRFLNVALIGAIDTNGKFIGGTKELPLIGNEAYVLTKDKIRAIHNLKGDSKDSISFAVSDNDGFDIEFPIDRLFNSHIAVFGNTGSGKSNTLAILFRQLTEKLKIKNEVAYKDSCRFLLFDFNGEYSRPNCICSDKKVYNLTTNKTSEQRIPLAGGLIDIETLSIIADATEKTQKPFIKRAIKFYKKIHSEDVKDRDAFAQGIIKNDIKRILKMSEKEKVDLLVDYLRQILPEGTKDGLPHDLFEDLVWNQWKSEILLNNKGLIQNPTLIEKTFMFSQISKYNLPGDEVSRFIHILYMQLIGDILSNRAQNEHVGPVINKLKGKIEDLNKIFNYSSTDNFWDDNFNVINLNNVNIDMKKTIPLLIAKKIYADHKDLYQGKILTIIVDEAHNILSHSSSRETDGWKDYRLEVFEEIIKEGRKFGVFVTLASQRPNDISPTITSQAHNYFIHRLVNQRDLDTISNVVSYIDKVTEESIPTLSTGVCIFSGIASQMPLKLRITPLDDNSRPKSETIKFSDILSPIVAEENSIQQ